MFSKKKQPPIRSLIAEGCHVQGNLSFSEGLRIDGSVEGSVVSAEIETGKHKSMVFVSQAGQVSGGIKADIIIVNGRVDGPIHANFLLELQPKARVHGDVQYKQLEMHPGALIEGRMLPLDSIVEAPSKPVPAIEAKKPVAALETSKK